MKIFLKTLHYCEISLTPLPVTACDWAPDWHSPPPHCPLSSATLAGTGLRMGQPGHCPSWTRNTTCWLTDTRNKAIWYLMVINRKSYTLITSDICNWGCSNQALEVVLYTLSLRSGLCWEEEWYAARHKVRVAIIWHILFWFVQTSCSLTKEIDTLSLWSAVFAPKI